MRAEKSKFEKLVEWISDYQDDYEFPATNKWVADCRKKENNLMDLTEKLETAYTEAIYSAQNLGFVQGIHFAYDIMEITESGKNRELLNQLLDILETSEEGKMDTANVQEEKNDK